MQLDQEYNRRRVEYFYSNKSGEKRRLTLPSACVKNHRPNCIASDSKWKRKRNVKGIMVTKDRRFQNHRAFVLNQTGVRSRFGIIMQIGFMRCTMDAEVLILHKPSHDKLNSPVMLCDTELDPIPRVTSERHLLEVIFKIAVA